MLERPSRLGGNGRTDAAKHPNASCDAKRSCSPARIMVVEDDEVTGRILTRLLEASGYDATHVVDYRTALSTACGCLPDVLISDIDLHATRDGCDVLKTMRQAYPGLRAISISGHERTASERTSRAGGFHAHLCKPFDYDELVETIERVMQSRRKSARSPAAAVAAAAVN